MMKTSNHQSHLLKSQMDSILHIVAEWVSVQEMKVLQGVFHAFVHLDQRKAIGRTPDDTGRPDVERSVRRLACLPG